MKGCTGCTDLVLLSPDFPVRMVVCQIFFAVCVVVCSIRAEQDCVKHVVVGGVSVCTGVIVGIGV